MIKYIISFVFFTWNIHFRSKDNYSLPKWHGLSLRFQLVHRKYLTTSTLPILVPPFCVRFGIINIFTSLFLIASFMPPNYSFSPFFNWFELWRHQCCIEPSRSSFLLIVEAYVGIFNPRYGRHQYKITVPAKWRVKWHRISRAPVHFNYPAA